MMAHARAAGDIPLAGLTDVGPLVKRLAAEGVLSAAELIQLRNFLAAAAAARRAFAADAFPHLAGYAQALEPCDDLRAEITRQIDDAGAVRDDATPHLAAIRKRIVSQREEIITSLERLIRAPRIQRALREPIYTERHGRYVLPVRTDSLGAVRGIIHAHSSSGVTAFVEPLSLVELNNRLEALLAAEEAEVEKILRTLSRKCAEVADALAADLELLEELDFVAARAGFGLAYEGNPPAIVDEPFVDLRAGRHPLLLASRPRAEVVPIDFTLGKGYVGMVISGPNNGGKTVALKTCGLLTAMALAGVPIPAAADSTVGSFQKIFADIGDESTIEGNLSTFTAHMTNVRRFLEEADGATLVLLDELGVGTSPKYGVAIGRAVLRALAARGARVACTTHYDELKIFAEEEEGFVNAAVEVDAETLAPTYVLKTGRPGTSEALVILARLGFGEGFLNAVKAGVGEEEVSLGTLLRRWEEREKEASELAAKVAALKEEYDAKLAALAAEAAEREAHAARLRAEAYDEAARVLREARQQAAVIIRELRAQKEIAAAEALRAQIVAAEKEAAAARDEIIQKQLTGTAGGGSFAPGDWVTVAGTATPGQVVAVDEERGRARVRFGAVEAQVDLGELVAAAPPARRPGVKAASPDAAPTLNVVGLRAEEAILEMEKFLDRAVVGGLSAVTVIHGHGTGRLRQAIRQYLRGHRAVAAYGPGPNGDEGVTVVQLRT